MYEEWGSIEADLWTWLGVVVVVVMGEGTSYTQSVLASILTGWLVVQSDTVDSGMEHKFCVVMPVELVEL